MSQPYSEQVLSETPSHLQTLTSLGFRMPGPLAEAPHGLRFRVALSQ